ncbi:MAG: DNA alkylation repair protein [Bacteroidia bacterium]|nr:DNA alkylation repair protein [Bacteroidia bacterium]
MNAEILNRKGARKVEDVPPEVLALLNEGQIETVNLTEWLAIDHSVLVQKALPGLGISEDLIRLLQQELQAQKKPTSMNSIKLVGKLLHDNLSKTASWKNTFKALSLHGSDSIRSYAPYLISLNPEMELKEKFNQIKPLVADTHFGVREVVWFAIRPEIDKKLSESIEFLSKWAEDEDENIRRFTTEATRPRGVWCKHIEALKEQPELAMPILEKLKSDPSKYVQDSVGNWLNDASKTRPDFVIELCEKWKEESPSKDTQKIIKRARRTINKK